MMLLFGTDYGHSKAKSLNLCPQIQIQISNILGFCINDNGRMIENLGKGLTVPNMGADSLVENTPNVPEFICSIFLLKPKSTRFQ